MFWLAPLFATLLVQTTSAFLIRLPPTIAPALTEMFAWDASAIGYLAALGTVGSILFMIAGAPLIQRFGSIRSLQIGLLIGAFATLLFVIPLSVAALAASFLIGLGYGPSAPAGSDILQRYAPARHRNLIFSIKQAGVPLGGVLAGLTLPPILEAWGWRATIIFSAALVVIATLLVQPVRKTIDHERNRLQQLTLRSFVALDNLQRPLAVLVANPVLRTLGLVGACFSIGQSVWFTFLVTYFVNDLGLPLTQAGVIFAVTQVTGVAGRMLLGWISDRQGSGLPTLKMVAVLSAATTLVLALTSAAWPSWALILLAAVAGVTVSSWNGVQIAEIARFAPPGRVGDSASGATILVFIGYVLGPSVFAVLMALTGEFRLLLLIVVAVTLLALVGLSKVPRQIPPDRPVPL